MRAVLVTLDSMYVPSLLTHACKLIAEQWICSPACTELEAVVMDWAAKLLGLSEEFYNTSQVGGGVLQVRSPHSIQRFH